MNVCVGSNPDKVFPDNNSLPFFNCTPVQTPFFIIIDFTADSVCITAPLDCED